MISEPILIALLSTEAALLVLTLSILFGHGLWLWCERRWAVPRLARARGALVATLDQPFLSDEERSQLQAIPRHLQVRLLAELAVSAGGTQHRRLTALARSFGLIRWAEAACRSRLWWRRLGGARLLTVFGGGEKVMPRLLHDRNPAVRAQAAEWVAEHPSPALIARLLELLSDAEVNCHFAVQTALLRMGRVVVGPLAEYLAGCPGPGASRALKVAAGLPDARFFSPAVALCRDERAQVRALAVLLIGKLGGGEAIPTVVGLLADPDPTVRASAARALGMADHAQAAGALSRMLRDPAWDVRREAGLALRGFGAIGVLFLRRSLGDSDRFAADMAHQVLDFDDLGSVALTA